MVGPNDQGPRFFVWLAASISLVLPWIGLALMAVGASHLYRGGEHGWLIYLGAGLVILDTIVDLWWAHPSVSVSDQPDLNARGNQLTGRPAIVEDAICDGRGKVRVGDTLWPAEGSDCPAGAIVRVIATRGTALVVEPIAQVDRTRPSPYSN